MERDRPATKTDSFIVKEGANLGAAGGASQSGITTVTFRHGHKIHVIERQSLGRAISNAMKEFSEA